MCQGIHKCTIPLDLKVPLTSIFQKLIDIFNLVLSSHLFHLSYELTLLIFFIHHHILVFTRRGHIQSYLIDFLSEFSLTRKKVLVSQSCPTLCDPMDCSPPGSSVHGILQARILEWITMPSSRGSSWPRDRTHVLLHLLHWQAGSLPLAPPFLLLFRVVLLCKQCPYFRIMWHQSWPPNPQKAYFWKRGPILWVMHTFRLAYFKFHRYKMDLSLKCLTFLWLSTRFLKPSRNHPRTKDEK